MRREKRGQPRKRRVDQALDAALGDRAQIGYGDRGVIERQRDRLAMKIAARQDLTLVGEDERVVGGAVDLDLHYAARMFERVAHGAVHLRHATQRIGVLHARIDGAVAVRLANFAVLDQFAQSPRARSLAGVRAGRMNLLVKGDRRPPQRFERHSPDHVRRFASSSASPPPAVTPGVPLSRANPSFASSRSGWIPARRIASPPGMRSPRKIASPSPTTTSARWASGARSPEAPTEPRDGITGCAPPFSIAINVSITAGRQPENPLASTLTRCKIIARTAASGSGSPTPQACERTRFNCSSR